TTDVVSVVLFADAMTHMGVTFDSKWPLVQAGGHSVFEMFRAIRRVLHINEARFIDGYCGYASFCFKQFSDLFSSRHPIAILLLKEATEFRQSNKDWIRLCLEVINMDHIWMTLTL